MRCIRVFAVVVSLLFVTSSSAEGKRPAVELRVMSFNLWMGGEAGGHPLEASADVVRQSGADIVGLQETLGHEVDGKRTDHGPRLAKLLGWHYLSQPDRRGIVSRFEIVRPSKGQEGALIRLTAGQEMWLFNVHFPAAPYQPYQLLGIEYAKGVTFIKTEEEAIAHARSARGKQVEALVEDMKAEGAANHPMVFVTGDFNEPSPQDWTEAAVKAGLCPVAVEWPSIKTMLDLGFVDAYRTLHPDPVQRPGLTWTPTTDPKDPNDHHDRIDFVLVCHGLAEDLQSAEVIGEKPPAADRIIKPWPSDHRAVLATVRASSN